MVQEIGLHRFLFYLDLKSLKNIVFAFFGEFSNFLSWDVGKDNFGKLKTC